MAEIVNDCSISVATVNGSGSQSANNVILKTLFRMGVPSGAKNLFPSNIAGLPTWYTIRINKDGYTARKKELDILVALNPSTWLQDAKSVIKGGVIIYNSDYPTEGLGRDDVILYPVPFKKIAEENFKEIKLRKLMTNMIYVGALTEILGLDIDILKQVVSDQFKGKEKVVESNFKAVQAGIDYAKENLNKTDPYRVEKMDKNTDKIIIDGNTASAMGSLYGGCTFLSWYPITPSSSLCENLIDLFEEFRVDPKTGEKKFAVVQAEDELASIGMVLGASWTGARAMTATSGPGISLMSEFTGFGYYAELPAVIYDVQRVGPSTGLPTRTMQGDIEFTYRLSHGDTCHPLLLPCKPEECFEFGQMAFDLADQLQTPVFVMSDIDLAMNFWTSNKFEEPTGKFERGKVLTEKELDQLPAFHRYKDSDNDGITYRTLPGTDHPKASYFVRGSGHNEEGNYTESNETYVRVMDRLKKKFETIKEYIPKPEVDQNPKAEVGLIAFGSTDLAMKEARDLLTAAKVETSYLRLRALPLTSEVREFFEAHERVYVIEQNRDAQVERIIRQELRGFESKSRSICHYDGMPIDARSIVDKILPQEGQQ